jgi:hypothetical protein
MSEGFNWREFVGLQPLPAQAGMCFYMEARVDGAVQDEPAANQITISVLKCAIECTMTEQEVSEKVEDMLQQFPIARSKCTQYNTTDIEQAHKIEIQMHSNNVARLTHRGFANKQHGNTHLYVGTSAMDAPIIVAQFEDKFGIFKHPKFDNYGFNFKP